MLSRIINYSHQLIMVQRQPPGSSSGLSCRPSAEEDGGKRHGTPNRSRMHSHQKKASPKRTEPADPPHCCSSSQTSARGLDSALDLADRRRARQSAESRKEGTPSQMEGTMGGQETSLGGDSNFRADIQGAQATQRAVQGSKFYRSSTAFGQDRVSSISASKKGPRLFLPPRFLRAGQ